MEQENRESFILDNRNTPSFSSIQCMVFEKSSIVTYNHFLIFFKTVMWVSPILGRRKYNGIPNTPTKFGKNLAYIFGKITFFWKMQIASPMATKSIFLAFLHWKCMLAWIIVQDDISYLSMIKYIGGGLLTMNYEACIKNEHHSTWLTQGCMRTCNILSLWQMTGLAFSLFLPLFHLIYNPFYLSMFMH